MISLNSSQYRDNSDQVLSLNKLVMSKIAQFTTRPPELAEETSWFADEYIKWGMSPKLAVRVS